MERRAVPLYVPWLLQDMLLQIPQIIFSIKSQKEIFSHLFSLSNIFSPCQQTGCNKTTFLLLWMRRAGLGTDTNLGAFSCPESDLVRSSGDFCYLKHLLPVVFSTWKCCSVLLASYLYWKKRGKINIWDSIQNILVCTGVFAIQAWTKSPFPIPHGWVSSHTSIILMHKHKQIPT